jgi:hypothetical protein
MQAASLPGGPVVPDGGVPSHHLFYILDLELGKNRKKIYETFILFRIYL